jgi:hypothetical protein
MNLFKTPGGNEFWVERSYMFSQPFQNYIDTDLMRREAHPKSKPFGATRETDRGKNHDL